MKKYYLAVVVLVFLILNCSFLFSKNDEEESYDDFVDTPIDWTYIFFDLGYGSSGPGGALGFRYWHLGASIGVTGFANDIPLTANIYPGQNIDLSSMATKNYPSNIVYGDLQGFYDFNEDYTFWASFGFYSAIDSVLAYQEEDGITAYYRRGVEKSSGITFGLGAQMSLYFINEDNPAFDQLVAGVGYHTKLGIHVRLSYRWE